MTEINFVANPHALFINGECTEVVFMQDYDEEKIKETLKGHTYDKVVRWEDYGKEIWVGSLQYGDRYALPKPFPSWVLHPDMDAWIAPKPTPCEVGTEGCMTLFEWDEELLDWVPPSDGDCCSGSDSEL